MGILIKFILKNLKEKKIRTCLIIFSITLSASLFFASSSMSDTLVKMYIDRLTQTVGTSDVLVSPKKDSPSPFFNAKLAEKVKGQTDYIIPSIRFPAYYRPEKNQEVTINLLGINLNELDRFNSINIIEQRELNPFETEKIIISLNTAEKYNLKIGDTIKIFINKVERKFIVSAISSASGIFLDESQSIYAIVPYKVLSEYLNAVGKSNMLYIKVNDSEDKLKLLKDLEAVYPKYSVTEAFTKEEFKTQTSRMSTPLMMMTIVVSFLSIFIIYSSFTVIAMERIPAIGTFRSIGATKKITNFVFIAESLLYGFIGGIFACCLGIGILYVMSSLAMPENMKGLIEVKMQFSASKLIITFLIANFICLISCIMPIIKVSRIPVKDIVLNSVELRKLKKKWNLILGIVLLLIAFWIPKLVFVKLSVVINVICLILSIVALIQLVPYLTGLFVRIFDKLFYFIFGNIGTIAVKNIRNNKSILNSITLISIGIATLLMINTVSRSVSSEVLNFYANTTGYDIKLQMESADKNSAYVLSKSEGVIDVFPTYSAQNVEIKGTTDKIAYIESVDKYKYLDYWHIDFYNNEEALFNELDTGRNILLTTILRDRLGLKVGDEITLKLISGDLKYKIIGFFYTLNFNGNYALISEKYLKRDTNTKFYTNIYLKTSGDPEIIANKLRDTLSRRHPTIETKLQIEKANVESNKQLFSILTGFSLLALLIGIVGVFNNLIISFMERRRNFAMLRSLGMSKKQIISMIFIESLTGGILGGVFGILAGIVMIAIVPYVMIAIKLPIPVHYAPEIFTSYLFGGILITVISSLLPAVKSSKLNIIESIKYQ